MHCLGPVWPWAAHPQTGCRGSGLEVSAQPRPNGAPALAPSPEVNHGLSRSTPFSIISNKDANVGTGHARAGEPPATRQGPSAPGAHRPPGAKGGGFHGHRGVAVSTRHILEPTRRLCELPQQCNKTTNCKRLCDGARSLFKSHRVRNDFRVSASFA